MAAFHSRKYVLGVDGCRTGWIAAALSLDARSLSFAVFPDFTTLLAHHASAQAIAVDMPIGLREDFAPRACDREARRLLGPRGSSIFPAPDRSLLTFCNLDGDKQKQYVRACEHSFNRCGKKISLQTFHLLPRIVELDVLLTPQLQRRVIEAHPELSFLTASGTQLAHAKRTAEGYAERRAILERLFPHIAIPERNTVTGTYRGAQPDDLLDAVIAAWSALRWHRGEAQLLPSETERDPRGLRMQIAV
ncbi:MAG: DUF429 domain-containing protein [Silvibacterium sp.]